MLLKFARKNETESNPEENSKPKILQKDRVPKMESFLRGYSTRTTIIEQTESLRVLLTVTLGTWPAEDGAVPYEFRVSRWEPEVEVEVYLLSGMDGSILRSEWYGSTGHVVMEEERRGYFEEVVLGEWFGWM